MKSILRILSTVTLALGQTVSYAQDASLWYTLSMPEPVTHYFEVTLDTPSWPGPFTDFGMPAWTPGSYFIRDFAKNVSAVSAKGNKSGDLKIEKTDKSTWRVYHAEAEAITLKYKVYAFELSVRASYLDDLQGYVNGSSVFMFPAGHLDFPIQLRIKPYSSWKKITTGLEENKNDSTLYYASDYDQLVDCPLEIGNHVTFTFNSAGIVHEVALVGPGNYDIEKMKKDMTRITQACSDIFGGNPNPRYVFIIQNTENGGGGLEHSNSASLSVNRWIYEPENSYIGFLGLVAHEYLHQWLVKRLRPASLLHYDYTRENYTDLLWIMEGFPSYYDDILLCRLGYITGDEYLQRLSGAINSIENSPGNSVLSVAASSYDAWIKQYQPDENQVNSTVSYYTKGNELAALIDLQVIASTGGKQSLNYVLRYLYEEYYKKKYTGITALDLKKAVEKISGADMDDFFRNYVFGTEPIDYKKYFGYAGLSVYNLMEDEPSPFLGLGLQDAGNKTLVQTVYSNSSAQQAGLSPGDEIIGADGYRVSMNEFFSYIKTKAAGDTLRLLISRNGVLYPKNLVLIAGNRKQYSLIRSVNPNNIQKTVYNQWLYGK